MYVKQGDKWADFKDFYVIDLICVQISFFISYCIRHGWGSNPYSNLDYLTADLIMCVALLITAIMFCTYADVLTRGHLKEFVAVFKHTAYTSAMTLAVLFFMKTTERFSRVSLFLMPIVYIFLANGTHFLWKKHLAKYKDEHAKSFLIVADEDKMDDVENNVRNLYSQRITISKTVKMEDILSGAVTADDIVDNWIDEALVVSDILNEKRASYEEQLKTMGITIHDALLIPHINGASTFVDEVATYPVFTTTVAEMTAIEAFYKRTLDIIGGIVGSILCVLILIIVGPIIYIKDPGPVIFKQTRIGKNGKRFTFLKIRSMYKNAEERKKELMALNKVQDGMMFKIDDDPRIIPGIGKFIRSHSLDEFPQFFNVLVGDMSLVGTRPPTEDEWEKYSAYHRVRLATKPGITGMWQVSGRSNITDFEEVLKLDTDYIYNWSMSLDIKILLKTVVQVFKKDGAE